MIVALQMRVGRLAYAVQIWMFCTVWNIRRGEKRINEKKRNILTYRIAVTNILLTKISSFESDGVKDILIQDN
jgi:hypothetical protein